MGAHSPSGLHLTVCVYVQRYDVHEHVQTLSWDAHNHSITCLAAAHRLQLLCSGAEDGRICLWSVGPDAATCTATFTIRPTHQHTSNLAIYALVVDPVSGEILFSGGGFRCRRPTSPIGPCMTMLGLCRKRHVLHLLTTYFLLRAA